MENIEKHSWFHVGLTVLTGIFKFIFKMILFLITAFLYVLTFLLKIPLFFIYWIKNLIPLGLIVTLIYIVVNFTYYYFFNRIVLYKEELLDNMFTQQRIHILIGLTVVLAGFTAFNQVRHLTYDDMD